MKGSFREVISSKLILSAPLPISELAYFLMKTMLRIFSVSDQIPEQKTVSEVLKT